MKKNNYIILSLLAVLFLMPALMMSQQSNFKTYIVNQQSSVQDNPAPLSETPNFSSLIQDQNEQLKYNVVSINQIGDNNNVSVVKVETDVQKVEQIGNNNYYNYLNYYNNAPLNLSVLQQGDSNYLQVYGRNSIIDKMSIVQKSNFKTVIVKNY